MTTPMKGPQPQARLQVTEKPSGAEDPENNGGRPESVRLMLVMFVVALLLELVALLLNIITTVTDPGPLMAAAREVAEDQNLPEGSEGLVEASAWGSLALVSLFYLVFIGILAGAVHAIHRNGRFADGARRLWIVFAIYFAFRALTVYLVSPAGSDVPQALMLIDGSVKILIAVAAVLGAVFATRPETREWITGATPDEKKP